jgi:hypothetical protein
VCDLFSFLITIYLMPVHQQKRLAAEQVVLGHMNHV